VLMWLGSGSPVRVFSTHDTLKVIERDGINGFVVPKQIRLSFGALNFEIRR
jgi:hypothetical protein